MNSDLPFGSPLHSAIQKIKFMQSFALPNKKTLEFRKIINGVVISFAF